MLPDPDELMISPVFRTCAPLDSHEYSARLLMISAALDHEDISSFFFFNVSLIVRTTTFHVSALLKLCFSGH